MPPPSSAGRSRWSLQARRSLQGLRAQWPCVVVLVVLAAAPILLAIAPGHWLRGAGLIAAAALLGAVFRLVLPPRRVGMLAVRARWFDALCYLALGAVILVTGLLLPG